MKHFVFKGLLAILFLSLVCPMVYTQPTFDIGNSEIAFTNQVGGPKIIYITRSNLVFDSSLEYTHKYTVVADGGLSGGGTVAWGYDGPWSSDAAAGDIDVVKDTLGCGLYEIEFLDQMTFKLNLTDAKWGAGSNTSVYKLLIDNASVGTVNIYVRTPGSSGTWSTAVSVSDGDSLTYWGLVQATHSASYTRERTTYGGETFHIPGYEVPLESTDVEHALLDVNVTVEADFSVPDGYKLLIEGFDEGLSGSSNTNLLFETGTGITVYGELTTIETLHLNEYIQFLSAESTPYAGDWDGVYCSSAERVWLNRVYIKYAGTGLWIDNCENVETYSSMISDCGFTGLRMEESSGIHQELTSINNVDEAVYISSHSNAEFHQGYFANTSASNGVLIDDNCDVEFYRSTVYNNNMHGIVALAECDVYIDSCEIWHNGYDSGADSTSSWFGVYGYYNSDWITIRHSKIHEHLRGVSLMWSYVRGYNSASYPPSYSNSDSLARNCIYENDYNIYGDYGTYEMAKAYYNRTVPHYQGGESSIYDANVLQGYFLNSTAYLQRNFWNNDTYFVVTSSVLDTRDALGADSADCIDDDPGGDRLSSPGATFYPLSLARYSQWEAMTPSALRSSITNQLSTLSAMDIAAAFSIINQMSTTAANESYFGSLVSSKSAPAVLLPAYRYLGAAQLRGKKWSSAASSFGAMTLYTPRASNSSYTAAHSMAALAMHYNGQTTQALASLDSLLTAFPGDRDLVMIWKLIGGGYHAGIPKLTGEIVQPEGYELHNAYPNPFNPTTTISFSLPERVTITLVVTDMLGKEMRVLAEGEYDAGVHTVIFNASNLQSGMYLYSLTAGSYHETKKIILVK